jgi:prepilin-type N-terminal cleavage/methylation domain-containing protein
MTRVGARGPAYSAAPDAGFTMIELMVTILVASVLMATAAWTFISYQRAHEQSSTAIRLTSTLRNAAERALSEGRTYCVYVNPTTSSFDTYRQDCSAPAKRVSRATTDSSRVSLTSVSFPAPETAILNQSTACSTAGACAYFYPRGNALAGTVQVTRQGSAKVYTIRVEGLTSRVSRS